METGPRARIAAALVAGALAFLAGALLASRELGSLGGDGAEYVLLAKAIRAGEGYRSAWGIGEAPLHTLYPPVFPLLLVPFVGGAPAGFLAAHLFVAACGGAAVAALALLFQRRGLGPLASAAAALAPALSILWLRCATDLLSELPFAALAFGALALLEGPEEEGLSTRRAWGAAALAAAAFYTRTTGLALLPAAFLALVVSRRAGGPAARLAAGALAAACAAWFAYGALASEGPAGYLGVLGSGAGEGEVPLPSRIARNLSRDYLPGLPAFVFPHRGEGWAAAGWTLWALAAYGAVLGAIRRRGGAPVEGFFVATLAIVSAWTFRDPRFGLPLAPLLVLFAVEGARDLAHRFVGEGAGKAAPAALALLLLVPNAVRLATHVYPRAYRAPPPGTAHSPARLTDTWGWSDEGYAKGAAEVAGYLDACDFLRGLPGPGAVVASNPRVTALLAGRRVLQPPPGTGPERLLSLARAAGARYVLVDRFSYASADAIRALRDAGTGGTVAGTFAGGVQVLRLP